MKQKRKQVINRCPAVWLDHPEVQCDLEKGHQHEHHARIVIDYDDGQQGEAELWWKSEEDFSYELARR